MSSEDISQHPDLRALTAQNHAPAFLALAGIAAAIRERTALAADPTVGIVDRIASTSYVEGAMSVLFAVNQALRVEAP
ncbi:hypothetical protein [Frankia sp. Cj3]|uniref:hypothetical protein n=1 Tax=Frankia sp. Cj3 TaxID=2880976 RepID=UPI001EF44CB7|nr:hypothetical protein [Frankia sp. Cj3]